MNFDDKYSQINSLFAELGCVIGCLNDSTDYDERFIDIVDRVIMINTGQKVDKQRLKNDLHMMLKLMEKEGYYREAIYSPEEKSYIEKTKTVKVKRRFYRGRFMGTATSLITAPFRLLKIYWQLPDNDGKGSLGSLALFVLGIYMSIRGWIYHPPWNPLITPSWADLMFVGGTAIAISFGSWFAIFTYEALNDNFSTIKKRYKESQCQPVR